MKRWARSVKNWGRESNFKFQILVKITSPCHSCQALGKITSSCHSCQAFVKITSFLPLLSGFWLRLILSELFSVRACVFRTAMRLLVLGLGNIWSLFKPTYFSSKIRLLSSAGGFRQKSQSCPTGQKLADCVARYKHDTLVKRWARSVKNCGRESNFKFPSFHSCQAFSKIVLSPSYKGVNMKSCPILQKLGGYVKHSNHDTWWKDEGDPLRTVAVRAISNFLPLLSGFFNN